MKFTSIDELMTFVLPGMAVAQSLYAAVRLGIADLLKEGPKTAAELAREAKTDPASLQRLLNALETMGLFVADAEGKVRNTAAGKLLRRDHPASLRPQLLIVLSPLFWRPMGELEHSIRTGRPAFDGIFGCGFFEYLNDHPEEGGAFEEWMNATSVAVVPAILGAVDFSRYRRIVDVGGGRGALLAGILSAHPHLRGVLYDQPAVIAHADAVRIPALERRCERVGGSFFDSVPVQGDAYILRAILHACDDEKARAVLRNCRRAMRPGATLLVLETLRGKGSSAEFVDLHMLVQLAGRERSRAEYEALFQQTGFELERVVRTDGPAILEAVAVRLRRGRKARIPTRATIAAPVAGPRSRSPR